MQYAHATAPACVPVRALQGVQRRKRPTETGSKSPIS